MHRGAWSNCPLAALQLCVRSKLNAGCSKVEYTQSHFRASVRVVDHDLRRSHTAGPAACPSAQKLYFDSQQQSNRVEVTSFSCSPGLSSNGRKLDSSAFFCSLENRLSS